MVEFRSVSLEIRGRKERRRNKEESAEKHKPTYMYVSEYFPRRSAPRCRLYYCIDAGAVLHWGSAPKCWPYPPYFDYCCKKERCGLQNTPKMRFRPDSARTPLGSSWRPQDPLVPRSAQRLRRLDSLAFGTRHSAPSFTFAVNLWNRKFVTADVSPRHCSICQQSTWYSATRTRFFKKFAFEAVHSKEVYRRISWETLDKAWC